MTIVEHYGENRTFYHVTVSENLESIMEKGLVPSVGERSEQLGEGASIFLFPSQEDAEDAVANWLGDQFDEDTAFALLEIYIPVEIEIHRSENVDWEVSVHDPIPPNCIKVLSKDF